MIRIAEIFKSIGIYQPLSNLNPLRLNPERNALFFCEKVNWAEIFLAMFEKGLSNLSVENKLGDHITAAETLNIIQVSPLTSAHSTILIVNVTTIFVRNYRLSIHAERMKRFELL